ncbi:Probable LRR receptor-like serine/threonine-protein kinase [Striga hermonthica]|uniref:Probable LRR receptor-like serine/threonine-protein kinase n=1 Tax=Striga hermonthica TaxID=68872 RepID=A0A9N7RTW3_STRHE|nr:Probable LRR receptor-like serine/threonine-protein kinase [Striga hermonthica]
MISLASFQVLLLSTTFLLWDCVAFPNNEVEALISFKRAVFEDPLLALSNWNPLDYNPCGWSGVYCSIAGEYVLKINISRASLKGFIAPEFYQLTYLQELILHGNLLIGTIPKEIGLLKNLKVLDFGSNQLTGPIPPEIGNLTGIQKINLQSNGLTGKLPNELGNLKYLEELRLDRNKFIGNIPDGNSSTFSSAMNGMYASKSTSVMGFCGSTQLKVVDLSYNFLVGIIPKCLGYLPRSSFQGNCLQDKDPKQRPATQCGTPRPPIKTHPRVGTKHGPMEDKSKHKSNDSKPAWLLALEIVTGIMVGLLFVVAVFTAFHKLKRKPSIIIPWKKSGSTRDYMTIYIDSEALKNVVRYSRQELEVACEDFSNIIGSSPDSLVYKGTLKGGPEIAVISLCIKEEHWTGYLELYFQQEVADLARLSHENIGKLLGYCRESNPFTRMLVFEYASNGTFYEHLHYGEGCQFSWTRRMKIIIGIARGLKYLHTELDPPFTISELNSSSVYLTEDFSPKLVDFECWKTVLSRSEKSSGAISNEGAVCILPNSLERRHLDIQGNIHAFGILLLEVVSGRPPYCKDKGSLLDWAKEYLDSPDAMARVVDPELKHFRQEDLKVICEAVNLCIHPSSSMRTSMSELCSMLETGIDTSISAEFNASSLAWAELALSS